MSSTVLLTTSNTFQITRDATVDNSAEIIAKRNIVSVCPTTFESKANYTEPTDWKYRYDTITIVTLGLRDGSELSFELQDISNQSSWNGGTLADLNQAIDDIKTWLADGGVVTYIQATGGLMIRSGDDIIHYFLSDDDFIINQISSLLANNTLGLFGAGGGGGGGGSNNGGSGGGGGGEAAESTGIATLGTFPAVIGKGGLGKSFNIYYGDPGDPTTFKGVTYLGGGGGGRGANSGAGDGVNGACGGGAGYYQRTGGVGSVGFNGGNTNGADGGAGGGGMGSAGSDNYRFNEGGAGGAGIICSIDGKYYGAGGGGGGYSNSPGLGGIGGSGVGGNGGSGGIPAQNGFDAVANSGSGGGGSAGGAPGYIGGNGSAGVAMAKYKSPQVIPALLASTYYYGSINGGTTSAIDTSNSTLIVITCQSYKPAGTATITDSEGNTWILISRVSGTTSTSISTYYCINPITNNNHTFTTTLTGGYSSITVSAFGGVNFAFDNYVSNTAGSGTSITSGSITPSSANNLVISTVNYWLGQKGNISNSFGTINTIPPTANTQAGSTAYKINALPVNPTWNWTDASGETAAMITSFTYS